MSMKGYIATRNFQLTNPPCNVKAGDHFQFDGIQLVVSGFPPQNAPQFRGAIEAGWAVPEGDFQGAVSSRPVSANIQVGAADGGNPLDPNKKSSTSVVSSEERYVGNISGHAQEVQEINGFKQPREASGAVLAEDQEGVPVRRLGNPDGRKNPTTVTSESIGRAIREAENRQIVPGKGQSREEVMAKMDPQQRKVYEAQIEARRAAYVEVDQRVAVQGPQSQGKVVGRIVSSGETSQDGIDAKMSFGGGTDTVDLGSGGAVKQATHVVEEEGIKVTMTGPAKKTPKAPKSPAAPISDDPRRVVAKSICPDFPDNYDFNASMKKKMARITADYEDRPDVIRAVAAAETDSRMKKKLVKEFPSAFSA